MYVHLRIDFELPCGDNIYNTYSRYLDVRCTCIHKFFSCVVHHAGCCIIALSFSD